MVLALLLALLASAAHASGGGIPSPNWGGKGATAPGRAFTYIALPSGRGSLVQASRRKGGAVDRWLHLRRRYGIPVAAYDGSMTGLSADGRVLVLAELPGVYPVRRTRLLILRATNFEELGRFSFPGQYVVTALSPHGRYVYLRRSTAPERDPLRTELTVLDRGNPGAPEVIASARSGTPIAYRSDGRWATTRFRGKPSWLERLDTVTRSVTR